jgi:hypothetical protein
MIVARMMDYLSAEVAVRRTINRTSAADPTTMSVLTARGTTG